MAARLAACGNQQVNTSLHLADGMLFGSDQGRDWHVVLLAHVQHDLWRNAQGVGN